MPTFDVTFPLHAGRETTIRLSAANIVQARVLARASALRDNPDENDKREILTSPWWRVVEVTSD